VLIFFHVEAGVAIAEEDLPVIRIQVMSDPKNSVREEETQSIIRMYLAVSELEAWEKKLIIQEPEFVGSQPNAQLHAWKKSPEPPLFA
jgi:hypothetical protein